jgi:peroxiredoxin
LQAEIDRFQAYHAQILAISVETKEQGQALQTLLHLTFPLLSDPEAQAIRLYAGLEEDTGRAKPATFVIDRRGRVAWSYIGKDANDRPTTEMILEALSRL